MISYFCTQNKHRWIASKAQFNKQNLGEIKADGYRAENRFFQRWKLQEKSTFVYIDFYTLLISVVASPKIVGFQKIWGGPKCLIVGE